MHGDGIGDEKGGVKDIGGGLLGILDGRGIVRIEYEDGVGDEERCVIRRVSNNFDHNDPCEKEEQLYTISLSCSLISIGIATGLSISYLKAMQHHLKKRCSSTDGVNSMVQPLVEFSIAAPNEMVCDADLNFHSIPCHLQEDSKVLDEPCGHTWLCAYNI